MLDVSDLIGIPYKEHGRDKNGLDCYGLVIEVARRLGHELDDVYYDNHDKHLGDINAPTLNVHKTDEIKEGTVLEIILNDSIHIGICLNDKVFIHSTYNQGVRISPIKAYPIKDMYTWD